MEWLTTTTLLESLQSGTDDTAWERLVQRFRPAIVRFARGMGLAESDAEEVAQETLIALLESQRQGRYVRSHGRLSSWLFGIAVRQARNVRRKTAATHARKVNGSAALDDLPDEQTMSSLWQQEWEQAVLSRCLQRVRLEVDPVTLRAFELVVAEGRSPAEAARILDVPIKTIYNAKHRVLHRIRDVRREIEGDENEMSGEKKSTAAPNT